MVRQFGFISTNVANLAPRENASIPTDPDPAYRSKNSAPSIQGRRISKRDFLMRAKIGRTPCASEGLLIDCRFALPPIIRIMA